MKKLNIFAMEINSHRDTNQHVRVYDNLRENQFSWPEGMFHRQVTKEIGLHFEYNNVSTLQDLKKFSDNNKPYVIFVKFYEFRTITGDTGEIVLDGKPKSIDESKSLMHYLFSNKNNQFIIDDINSKKCKFILAGLTELSSYDYYYYFSIFNKQMEKYNLDQSKITFFEWVSDIQLLKKFNSKLNFKYFNWLMVSWKYYLNFPNTQNWFCKNGAKDKKYISLNHTVKAHRFLLIDFLRKNELLDDGFVSFFHNKFKIKFFDAAKRMDWTKKQANEFYEWLNLNPLSVDVDLDFDYQKKFNTSSFAPNEIFNQETDLAYKKSYFNILSETSFFESYLEEFEGVYLNERNVLPINTFQPFIVLNSEGHMKQFRKLGFKSFHPYIDESYDKEKDPYKRFEMIKKEILRLNNMSMEQLHDWYWSMEEILIHNYNHYHKKFIPKQIQGFYNEFIFE